MLNKQTGFTLVELMVGLTIGLIVLAGVLKFFSTIVGANAEAVKQQQFEQTVHALIGTISADIRRAGYTTPTGANVPPLTVGGVNVGTFYANGDCLLLTYRNPDNSIAYRGYLRDATKKAFYVLASVIPANPSFVCDSSNSLWNPDPVTDSSLLTVEAPTTAPSSSSVGTSATAVFQADGNPAFAKLKWIHFTLTSVNLKTQSGENVSRDVVAAVTLRN